MEKYDLFIFITIVNELLTNQELYENASEMKLKTDGKDGINKTIEEIRNYYKF